MNARKKAVLLNCIVLGDSAVGKTMVCERFRFKTYHETYSKPLRGFSYWSVKIDNAEVKLLINDTNRKLGTPSIGGGLYEGANVFILVYDITVQRSFDSLTKWAKGFLELTPETKNRKDSRLLFVVLGNKADLAEYSQTRAKSFVSKQVAERFCQQSGFKFFEISAKKNWLINEALRYIVLKGVELQTSHCRFRRVPWDLDDYEVDDSSRKTTLFRNSARSSELGARKSLDRIEVLWLDFDNTFVPLILDRSFSNQIQWRDSRTNGVDQIQLHPGYISYHSGKDRMVLESNYALWKLQFRSKTYILCDTISMKIYNAVKKPYSFDFDKWDWTNGLKGTAKCLKRSGFKPGPFDIDQSASVVLYPKSALHLTIKYIIQRLVEIPNYIVRIILQYSLFSIKRIL